MRFPNTRNLNDDQEAVYLYAPTEGRSLVTGPPGTGKTVLAVLRALEVARQRRKPVVAMFNSVLETFTAAKLPETEKKHWENIRFTTISRQFSQLWDALGVPPSHDDDWIFLNTPFDEKDEAKALGAVWDPDAWNPVTGRKKCWKVESGIYWQRPADFERWTPRVRRPSLEGKPESIDWARYFRALNQHAGILNWDAIDFDVLIIDEAQDFPPDFFRIVYLISEGVFGNGLSNLMILADENQRITEENSSVSEIRDILRIPKEFEYTLRTNFRNTRDVAQVARHFFAGMSTGMPELPDRRGPVPELRRSSDEKAVRARILRYMDNNPRHEVGLICLGKDPVRATYYRELKDHAPRGMKVQTYSSVEAIHRLAKDLEFDKPGISILNQASCKGLEFDAVFLVGLEGLAFQDHEEDFLKMKLYVMCSRSRESLFLIWKGHDSEEPTILALMPEEPLVKVRG